MRASRCATFLRLTAALGMSMTLSVSPANAADTSLPITTSTRIFSPDSFFYREFPSNAPLDSQNSTKMNNIVKVGFSKTNPYYNGYGQPQMAVNNEAYTRLFT